MFRSKFESYAGRPQTAALSLVGFTLLAIAGKLSLDTSFAMLPSLAMLGIASIALLVPWLGLLALFPLSFALEFAPQGLGLREIAYAGISASVMLGTMLTVYRDGTLTKDLCKWGPFFLVAVLFLAVNFYVARLNAVSLADWVRGLIPFVFISLFWPVVVMLRQSKVRLSWLAGTLALMALLFVGQVLVVYFVKGLNHPSYYLLINGEYIPTAPPLSPDVMGDKLGPYYNRITMLLPQSTDALLPLTFSVAYVMSILAPSKNVRRAMFVLTCVASTSILATYTRSMLLCALISICVFGLMLLLLKRDVFMRALSTGLALVAVSVIIAFAINLGPVWHNRALELYYSLGIDRYVNAQVGLLHIPSTFHEAMSKDPSTFHEAMSKDPSTFHEAMSKDPSTFHEAMSKDPNVLTRLEEYRIALGFFYAHPITGAGLGVQHQIAFATSTGENLVQQVGYVHNWAFYFLMVGGMVGALAYGAILSVPSLVLALKLFLRRNNVPEEEAERNWMIFNALWVGFLTIGLYALFFAVFRLITFNLVLAAGLGITAYLTTQYNRTAQ